MTSMERWWNKVAVVTGASSGIGAACAIDLVKGGMIVAGIARRKDRLEVLREKLPDELKSRIHSYKCDVSKEADVIQTFQLIKENLGTVHVLVNSAGMASSIELTGMYCTDEIRENINLGIMGAAFCIREAFNQMKEANVKGHIVLMNSTFGRRNSPFPLGSLNIYPAVKSALIAMSETYIKEFSSAGTDIKMTTISPGAVNSNIIPVSFKDLIEIPMLRPEDVSSAIIYCISTPPNVQIKELTIKPLHEVL